MKILELQNKTFEKKDELIQSALEEFSEHGYENASLNTILKNAGLSKGAFYHHFKNKEELYLFLISKLANEKQRFFEENYKINETDNFFEILKSLVQVGMQFSYQNPLINKFSQQFLKNHKHPIYKKVYGDVNNMKNEYLSNLIENAYDNQQIRNDVPKDFVINMINYLFINLSEISNVVSIEDYEESSHHLIKFMKDGFGV